MFDRLRQMLVAPRRIVLANLPSRSASLQVSAVVPLATMNTESFADVSTMGPDLLIKSAALSTGALQILQRWKCNTPKDFLARTFAERNKFYVRFPMDFENLAEQDPRIPAEIFNLSCIQYVDCGLPTALDPSEMRSKLDLYFVSNTGGPWCIDVVPTRMIRPAEYISIWDALQCQLSAASQGQLIGAGNGLLIMGHPGIGKSLFLDLLLSWSLHWYPTMPIIVIAAKAITMFASGRRYDCTCEPSDFLIELHTVVPKGSQILVLHDIKSNQSLHYQCGLVGRLKDNYITTVVVASSPHEGNYKDFRKEIADHIRYVLPALTSEESDSYLRTMSDKSAAERRDLFYNVGGVPRSFTSVGQKSQLERMRVAAPSLNFDPFVHRVTRESAEMTNAVVMGIPSLNRSKYDRYDFVSRRARNLWAEALPVQKLACLIPRMRVAQDDPSRDLFDRMFEQWALLTLSASPNCCYQPIFELGAAPGAPIRWLQLKQPLSVQRFRHLSDLPGRCAKPTLCLPTCPQFPDVDAFLICDNVATLIQVTVAGTHGSTVEQMRATLKDLGDKGLTIGSIVWIVDISSTPCCRQKLNATDRETFDAYEAIPQFLCRISERMFWVKDGANDALCFPVAQTDDMSDATTVARCITEHLQILQPKLPSVLTKGTLDDPLVLLR